MLVVSAVNSLTVIEITTQKIVNSIKNCIYTALFLLDDDLIACGGGNGTVEIRSLLTLTMIANGQTYNTFHTDQGHRYPLDLTYPDTQALYTIPFAVKGFDYCTMRNCFLSVSVGGEVFLWNRSAVPLAHINISFGVTAASFFNGNGSILISAFEKLYIIDWREFFENSFLPIGTMMDDFDLRTEATHIVGDDSNKPAPIILDQKTEKINEHADEIDISEIKYVNPIFENLVVDIIDFPKRHFAPPRPDEIEERILTLQYSGFEIEDVIPKEVKEEPRKRRSGRSRRIPAVTRSLAPPPPRFQILDEDEKSEDTKSISRKKRKKIQQDDSFYSRLNVRANQIAPPKHGTSVENPRFRVQLSQSITGIPTPSLTSDRTPSVTITVPLCELSNSEDPSKSSMAQPSLSELEDNPQEVIENQPQDSFQQNSQSPVGQEVISSSSEVQSRFQKLVETGQTPSLVTAESSYLTEIPNSVPVDSISTERKMRFPLSESASPPTIPPPGKSPRGHRHIRDQNPEKPGGQGKSHNSLRRLKWKRLQHFSGDNEAELISNESNELTTSSRRGSIRTENARYDRVTDRDDMIFTSYRIDGFRQPFGGFKFLKRNESFDPPVVQVKKASCPRHRSKSIPKSQRPAIPTQIPFSITNNSFV